MNRRGALLGPEESGRPGKTGWTGFSGSLAVPAGCPRFGGGGWCGGVAGAGLHQTVVMGLVRGCFSSCGGPGSIGGGSGLVFLPVF